MRPKSTDLRSQRRAAMRRSPRRAPCFAISNRKRLPSRALFDVRQRRKARRRARRSCAQRALCAYGSERAAVAFSASRGDGGPLLGKRVCLRSGDVVSISCRSARARDPAAADERDVEDARLGGGAFDIERARGGCARFEPVAAAEATALGDDAFRGKGVEPLGARFAGDVVGRDLAALPRVLQTLRDSFAPPQRDARDGATRDNSGGVADGWGDHDDAEDDEGDAHARRRMRRVAAQGWADALGPSSVPTVHIEGVGRVPMASLTG